MASCTLDASTKIYSFRVDAVHSDVVQMASSMGHADLNRKKKGGGEDDNVPDDGEGADELNDGPPESQVLKKLRKKTRRVTHQTHVEERKAKCCMKSCLCLMIFLIAEQKLSC